MEIKELEQIINDFDLKIRKSLNNTSYENRVEYIYWLSIISPGGNLSENEIVIEIFRKYPNKYLIAACHYFAGENSKSVIRKYFKAITKNILESEHVYIQKHINSVLESVLVNSDSELLPVFLNEVNNKKYLIPILEFTWKLDNNYVNSIFKVLLELDEYHLIVTIFEKWLSKERHTNLIESGGVSLFTVAYSYAELDRKMKAKDFYEIYLDKNPSSVSAMNNLAIIYYEELKEYNKALSLLKTGREINPDDEFINRNIKKVQELIKLQEKRPDIIKDRYFKKIESPAKSILFTIYKFSTADDDIITYELLSKVSSITNEKYLKANIKQLIELELITYSDETGYVLDEVVYKLIQDYKDPKLDRQIVQASNKKLYRPIFFHESEINLYRVLIELFSQQLVFPNMDLKAIIDVDKIRGHLDNDVMEYLFKAHVDFAIISNVTYLPLLAIEKDSEYQDKAYNAANASRKNIIFQTSGLPLIRIRFNSAMDVERLKEEVKLATKDLLLQVKGNDDPNNILNDFNLKAFGIYDAIPNVDELREKWGEIVGETIFNETKDIVFDANNAVVQILLPISLKAIMEIGLEQIKGKIYEAFPAVNALKINYVGENNEY